MHIYISIYTIYTYISRSLLQIFHLLNTSLFELYHCLFSSSHDLHITDKGPGTQAEEFAYSEPLCKEIHTLGLSVDCFLYVVF